MSSHQDMQDFIRAAGRGDLARLEVLAADATLLNKAGEDALAEACERGQLPAVQFLHGKAVRLDGFFFDQDNPSVTIHQYPLHCAAQNRHWQVVAWLLDQGVPVTYVPRLLGNLVGENITLFTRVLTGLPFIDSWRAESIGWQEKEISLLREGFDGALRVVMAQDRVEEAKACLDAGLTPAEVCAAAMTHHASRIMQYLFESGYRPDNELLAQHQDPLNTSVRALEVKKVLAAWARPAPEIVLDNATRAAYKMRLAADPLAREQRTGLPLAVALTRAGYFTSDVAPLVATHGMPVLQAACGYGCTVADVAAGRGELHHAFDAAHWVGREAEMRQHIAALPPRVQPDIDLGAITAAFRRQQLGSRGAGRGLKLGLR